MSSYPANNSQESAAEAATPARPRRALVVAGTDGLALERQLASSGYSTRTAPAADASRAISEFSPDVVVMVVAPTGTDGENESVALARRLRAETATYALPVVFAWSEDERALRASAQYVGADDYFCLSAPPLEILARLDSLFWRVEVDRRSTSVVSDRRLEIDNFMFMLDAVREDVRAGVSGTLALVYAVAAKDRDAETFDKTARDRTLTEAHAFLKLNLRRMDGVAFYGPTTLVIYLPHMKARSAVAALTRLHREFTEDYPEHDLVAGVASFPAHGGDVETLIEKAERAVAVARAEGSTTRVVAYDANMDVRLPPAPLASREVPQRRPQEVEEVKAPTPQAAPAPVVSAAEPGEMEAAEEPAAAEELRREAQPAKEIEAAQETEPSREAQPAKAAQSSEEDAARAAEAAASERERRASGAVMPRRLLLTISDSARMAQVNSLIRSAGYEARAAFDGQQALHLLRIERPDLLLLDYDLQGIDGVETIRRLRKQNGGRLSLPVVMLLPAGQEQARREALKLGAHSVHVTPYDPVELLRSVRLAGTVE
ncbi:MAG TPA: response regulator [Pyrinomonadaceae bacterium]|nr:response regulator [Pyrinomonadaceae bacterium]